MKYRVYFVWNEFKFFIKTESDIYIEADTCDEAMEIYREKQYSKKNRAKGIKEAVI
jgi:hypothetical protein